MDKQPGRGEQRRGLREAAAVVTVAAALAVGCAKEGTPPSTTMESAKPPATARPNLPTTTTTIPEVVRKLPFNIQQGNVLNGTVTRWGDLDGVTRAEICAQHPPAFPGRPEEGSYGIFWTTGMVAVGESTQIMEAERDGNKLSIAFANPPLRPEQVEAGVIDTGKSGAANIEYGSITVDYVAGAIKRGDGDVCVAQMITSDTTDPTTDRITHHYQNFVSGGVSGPYTIKNGAVSSEDGVLVEVPVG